MRKGFPVTTIETGVPAEPGTDYITAIIQDVLRLHEEQPELSAAQIADRMTDLHGRPSSASARTANTEIARLMDRDRAKESMIVQLHDTVGFVLRENVRIHQHCAALSGRMEAFKNLHARSLRAGVAAVSTRELGELIELPVPRMHIAAVPVTFAPLTHHAAYGEFTSEGGQRTFYPYLGESLMWFGSVGTFRVESVFQIDQHRMSASQMSQVGYTLTALR